MKTLFVFLTDHDKKNKKTESMRAFFEEKVLFFSKKMWLIPFKIKVLATHSYSRLENVVQPQQEKLQATIMRYYKRLERVQPLYIVFKKMFSY